MNLVEAYAACETITATEARNFSYGIKLLPKEKRQAMSALYALARRIDDIGDGEGDRAGKMSALAETRKQVADLRSERPEWDPGDPVMTAVADVSRRYPLPVTALEELITGCEMDVAGARYETIDDLVGYCRRVAGTVGRLSLSIYGTDQPERASVLADDLGVALQITNILRDIVEDQRSLGRVYLPVQDLARFGLGPDLEGDTEDIIALVAFETARAEEWYERGLLLLPMLDRRSRACTAAMAGIYHRLLTTIRRDPGAVLRGRLSLPTWQKLGVAGRALTTGTA
ncbi:MAG TPA: squalene/phytoene synthase family protein [Acidimicrobiales bacterium]|nr:squalene/phytoene synthase family protein [Acidimicrobiales bacterium]